MLLWYSRKVYRLLAIHVFMFMAEVLKVGLPSLSRASLANKNPISRSMWEYPAKVSHYFNILIAYNNQKKGQHFCLLICTFFNFKHKLLQHDKFTINYYKLNALNEWSFCTIWIKSLSIETVKCLCCEHNHNFLLIWHYKQPLKQVSVFFRFLSDQCIFFFFFRFLGGERSLEFLH